MGEGRAPYKISPGLTILEWLSGKRKRAEVFARCVNGGMIPAFFNLFKAFLKSSICWFVIDKSSSSADEKWVDKASIFRFGKLG